MDKHRTWMVYGMHGIWAIGLGLMAQYIEYGVMNVMGRFGMGGILASNILVGALIFVGFYYLEKRLVAQELSRPVLFNFASYVIPLAYQWLMVVKIGKLYEPDDQTGLILSGIFTFACLFIGIALLMRGMTVLFKYVRNKMSENRPLVK